jgi:hypothetical protein
MSDLKGLFYPRTPTGKASIANSTATPSPTMPGTFSVPARRPDS